VIFVPAYLNGHDGFINMPYYEALAGCDLGVFPSYYEPWGYTPLESAAYAIPTVTTDQAGFGLWAKQAAAGDCQGIMLLNRLGQPENVMTENLHAIFRRFLTLNEEALRCMRANARAIAVRANWKEFFRNYQQAYSHALDVAGARAEKLAAGDLKMELRHTFAGTVSVQPYFRTFTAVANLPEKIVRLRELAHNLWWAWNPRGRELFSTLDPKLWERMGNNPVRMLETVSTKRLLEASENASYMSLYDQILRQFDEYMIDRTPSPLLGPSDGIKWSQPVAYFSTEYGLHDCLPIYSGGLGTLSGDHLKTASDLNLPLVGIGLLYKQGFFRQVIDKNGAQTEEYPENDFSRMPLQIVQDERGDAVQISLDLPGRTLFANIWEVQVGRISLYLWTPTSRGTPPGPEDHGTALQRRTADEDRTGDPSRQGRDQGAQKAGHPAPRLPHQRGALGIPPVRTDQLPDDGRGALLRRGERDRSREHGVYDPHPVEAGNEKFSSELIEHYFANFVNWSGISWSQFWELGRKESGEGKPFFMTILALKMAHKSNAVSRLHGEVSRRMWRDVWKGFDESDIPIGHVTNGAHMLSYISARMKTLLDTYLGMGWERQITDPKRWERIQDIPTPSCGGRGMNSGRN